MIEPAATAVELASIREILRMYCHAVSEREVDLQDLKVLVEKNIGWSHADVATSDGSAIFLPALIDRFETEPENFAFLKVMLTQQAGHLEFGSFEFQFDRPSMKFVDLRPKLAAPTLIEQSTTAFAPIIVSLPICIGPSSFAPEPMSTLLPITGANF